MPLLRQDADPKSKRNRRWISGVGVLMLVVAAVAVPSAILSNRAREEMRLVKMVEETNGQVFFDYQIAADGGPSKVNEPHAPRWLRRILGDAPFRTVGSIHLGPLYGGPIPTRPSNQLIESLSNQPQLARLSISSGRLNDEQCQTLGVMTQLRILRLYDSPMSRHGAESLAHLRRLESIEILAKAPLRQSLETLATIKDFPIMAKEKNEKDATRLRQPIRKEAEEYGLTRIRALGSIDRPRSKTLKSRAL